MTGGPAWKRSLGRIADYVAALPPPSVSMLAAEALGDPTGNPLRVLISTMISLRTRDAVTEAASRRLFALADTAIGLAKLQQAQIAAAIYPAGFYRTKAISIRATARQLLDRFHGMVPADLEALVTLPGVGRKTANLVLTLGFGKPGICVDTHVHRIANRMGWVATKNPDDTEMRLREILPRKYWIPINGWLVTYGQRICRPRGPLCLQCRVADVCPRIGTTAGAALRRDDESLSS